MKIIVIGSKGFIGSHLLSVLRKAGHTVYGCDVIQDPVDMNYFQFHYSENTFDIIFSNNEFDVCFNCSGSASVPFSYEHPSVDFQLNVTNLFDLLEAIRKYRPSTKVIQLSSAAVYGNPTEVPIRITHSVSPVSIYGFHKGMAEQICREFHQIYQLNISIARIFSAYGEGLRKQLFWDLYQKSLMNNQVELFGTGNESRDFIHVSDLVKALLLLMHKGKGNAQVYNVASGIQITVKEAATLFLKNFSTNHNLHFSGNLRVGDPIGWQADITELKQLGFSTEVSFETGIKKYTDWLRTQP